MFAPDSVASHIRPVESTSIVAVSLPVRVMEVPVDRLAHSSYVAVDTLNCTEYSCGAAPYSRMCVKSPTARTSACVSVAADRRRTGLQERFAASFQIHVPAGDCELLGATIHQLPEYCHSLDCGLSEVEADAASAVSPCVVAAAVTVSDTVATFEFAVPSLAW